ncbi:hypothetical protein [Peribacillus alkalitolerans]|uniref:hypothetical protein n=1 Tax=Peribacillus alkalitolerans TaxID=1550385 RepID=UPI0013D86DBB|nr:hypothetical protein [Peribacillus alkalitolerans]
MKSTKLSLYVSLFVLVVFPIIFLVISLITGQWRFLTYSIIPSFFAGLSGLMVSIQQMKKENRKA